MSDGERSMHCVAEMGWLHSSPGMVRGIRDNIVNLSYSAESLKKPCGFGRQVLFHQFVETPV